MSDPGKHPCDVGDGEIEHDWKYVSDWYGDPGVINGTADCSHWECRTCGEEDHERGPPNDDDDYFYGDDRDYM